MRCPLLVHLPVTDRRYQSQMTVDVLLLCAPLLSVFLPLLLLFERSAKSVMEEMAEQKESGGRSRTGRHSRAEQRRNGCAVAMIKD